MNFLRTFVCSLFPAELCFVLVTELLSPSAGHGPGTVPCVLAMPPALSPSLWAETKPQLLSGVFPLLLLVPEVME